MGREIEGPFLGSRAIGQRLVCRYQLRHHYTRLFPDVYVHKEVQVDPVVRAQAAWCWADGRGVLAGWSAAAMWGTKWIPDTAPATLNIAQHFHAPTGLEIYRDSLADGESQPWRSYEVTTPARTAFDLGRRLDLEDAVEVVDALYQSTQLTRAHLAAFTVRYPTARGLVRLRTVIDLSDEGAESPWETKTRLAIVRAGLPRPRTQLTVVDDRGRFIARVDLAWERWKVIVEYDGDDHFTREQRNRDIERWNALEAAGWRVIRVKARQLMNGRPLLLEQIRQVLRAAGAPV